MMPRTSRWTVPLVLLPLLVSACSDDSLSDGTARVSLSLTDRAGDVDLAWVEIDEIYLQGGGNEGRTILVDQEAGDDLGLIELTELAGTTLDLIDDVEIAAGNYGQLRFVIEGAVVEADEEVFTFNADHPGGKPATGSLTCPSCAQTGIKVLLPGEVADLEAGSHLIVLDFDVHQSFGRAAGQSGRWVMSPVIRAAELGFSGAVSGVVDVERDDAGEPLVTIPECPAGTSRDLTAFTPEAVAENLVDDVGVFITSTTGVASDGSFSFRFLHPDQYDLGFVADTEFDGGTLTFEADAPGLVDVTSGGNATVAYTITSASCSEG